MCGTNILKFDICGEQIVSTFNTDVEQLSKTFIIMKDDFYETKKYYNRLILDNSQKHERHVIIDDFENYSETINKLNADFEENNKYMEKLNNDLVQNKKPQLNSS